PVLLIEVHDHLGVALGRKPVSLRLEELAQLAVVVDLTVEGDDDRAVLVVDRLVAGLEVDDPKPLHAEADAVLEVNTPRIRSAVPNSGAHPLTELAVDCTPGRHL